MTTVYVSELIFSSAIIGVALAIFVAVKLGGDSE